MTARCEPPEGWRERDGDHWLNAIDQELVAEWSAEFQMWHCGSRFGWQRLEQMAGFTYLSPVAPPAVVRGLVEALEDIEVISNQQDVRDLALHALAKAKEAGL